MLTRSEDKLVRGLLRRRVREAEGLFLAEGVRVVEELLEAQVVPRMALVSSSLEDTERGSALGSRLEAATRVHRLTPSQLGQLTDARTDQGVLVVAETPEKELESVEPEGPAVALVLDGVQDPGNLGTLARVADAFGCLLLAGLPGTVDAWNPKAVRASAGALFRLPVVWPEAEALWGWLDRHGFSLLGADAAGAAVGERPGSQRTALVVGNEGAGLSPEVRARCEGLVAVPMRGRTESLNVAVAGGILMYEMTRELD